MDSVWNHGIQGEVVRGLDALLYKGEAPYIVAVYFDDAMDNNDISYF